MTNCLMDIVKEALHDHRIQRKSLLKTILQLQCQMGKEVLKYHYLQELAGVHRPMPIEELIWVLLCSSVDKQHTPRTKTGMQIGITN